jgi:hypothetical protein
MIWIIALVAASILVAWAVYEFFWGDCDCEGCEYMRQQQEHDFQKERDWQNR